MTKKFKKEIKKLPKKLMAFTMIFAMLISYFAPVSNVRALELQDHGTGTQCFIFDMDENGMWRTDARDKIWREMKFAKSEI